MASVFSYSKLVTRTRSFIYSFVHSFIHSFIVMIRTIIVPLIAVTGSNSILVFPFFWLALEYIFETICFEFELIFGTQIPAK